MLINFRNALMAGRRLPYDVEIEYLESTGTQYIQTDYTPTIFHNFKAVVAMMDLNDSNIATSIGTAKSEAVNALIPLLVRNNSLSAWQVGSFLNISGTAGEVHTITSRLVQAAGYPDYWSYAWYDSGRFIGQAYQRKSNPIEWLGRMTVFACSYDNGDVNRLSKSRFYSFSATDVNSGESVIDLIPVRKGMVGYLYDRVSGKLFGNAGTGDFVLGSDVVPVEYIESHGTEWIDTGVTAVSSPKYSMKIRCSFSTPTSPTVQYWGADSGGTYGLSSGNFLWSGGVSAVAGRVYDIFYQNTEGVRYGEVDGVRYTGGNYSSLGYRCLLFCAGQYGTGKTALFAARLYGAEFVSADNLAFKSVPVRVGTDATSWEGAMMDTLTRRIYRNAGTGAFGYGNDLKYPIPA